MSDIEWKSCEDGREIACIAVCGCGVVHNCQAALLVCPACKRAGVNDGKDADGYFESFALYRKATK